MNAGFDFIVILLIWGTALLIFLPLLPGVPSADDALAGIANALSSIARNITQLP